MRSAPVRGGGGNCGSSSKVSLTEGEVRAAEDGTHLWNVGQVYNGRVLQPNDKMVGEPIGIQEFARRKRTMMAEGRYDTVPHA